MGRIIGFLFGLVAYAVFFGTFLYAIGLASDLSRLHRRVLGDSRHDGRASLVRGRDDRVHLRRDLPGGARSHPIVRRGVQALPRSGRDAHSVPAQVVLKGEGPIVAGRRRQVLCRRRCANVPPCRELAMALAQEKSDRITRRDPNAVRAVLAALTAKFGNRVVTSQAVREQHANTTTWIANEPPDAVVFPEATGDVQDIVRICAKLRVPVIPFGTGTSLEGHINAPYGGVSIDFRDMNRVLAVNAQDLDCVVEPGITRKQLNEHLRDQGLFFPLDPGADASLGGMAATRCSGTNAVRYGTMKDNVLALKVVLANGELMTTARRARKSSAGYDLTRLIVGA